MMILEHSQKIENFGAQIIERLKSKHWNQSDLARATGLGRDSISTYIHGTVRPTPKNLSKIAEALDCSPADLLPDIHQHDKSNAVLEMSQLPDGKVRLRVIQSVTLDQAVEIFNILKR
jgi:transcriptional regulator with XRE-family HTH domain